MFSRVSVVVGRVFSGGSCRGSGFFAVDRFGVDVGFALDLPCVIFEAFVEAGAVAVVAGDALLFDFDEDDVLIAIGAYGEDFLRVAARFAFEPEFSA